jgi:dTDP-glucose 4,6-dehydratase
MARVVVTGGAGPPRLAPRATLLDRGDRGGVCRQPDHRLLSTTSPHLAGDAGFEFVRHDVSNHVEVAGPVDWSCTWPARPRPKDFGELPIQIMKVGGLGTHNMLGLAKAKGARFFLASTSEVYGDPQVHPQPETYWGNVNPVGPRGVYDEAKRFAEAMTMAYHRHHGLDVRIARIFNTYGPPCASGRPGGVQLPRPGPPGRPLTIYGDGTQTRSFCYVDDEVEGLLRLARLRPRRAGEHRQPRRVHRCSSWPSWSRGDRQRQRDRLRAAAGRRSRPAPPDITLAREVLGWEPHRLREGLARTEGLRPPPRLTVAKDPRLGVRTRPMGATGRRASAQPSMISSKRGSATVAVGLVEGSAGVGREAGVQRVVVAQATTAATRPSTSPWRSETPQSKRSMAASTFDPRRSHVDDRSSHAEAGVQLRGAHQAERFVVEGDERWPGRRRARRASLLVEVASQHQRRAAAGPTSGMAPPRARASAPRPDEQERVAVRGRAGPRRRRRCRSGGRCRCCRCRRSDRPPRELGPAVARPRFDRASAAGRVGTARPAPSWGSPWSAGARAPYWRRAARPWRRRGRRGGPGGGRSTG